VKLLDRFALGHGPAEDFRQDDGPAKIASIQRQVQQLAGAFDAVLNLRGTRRGGARQPGAAQATLAGQMRSRPLGVVGHGASGMFGDGPLSVLGDLAGSPHRARAKAGGPIAESARLAPFWLGLGRPPPGGAGPNGLLIGQGL